MTTYKGIKGFKVRTLASDPLASGIGGAVWSSGGNLPTALSSVRGLGSQTAAVAVGGLTLPGPTNNATFHYDGSSWSTVPATLNTARGFANISKLGTQTAGIYFGGSPYLGNTESYNGTSWTEVNDLNTTRQELGGSGIQTAALATGGRISSPAYIGNNESWNGSTWTEVADLNTARGNLDSTGTSTDSIAGGGTIAPGSPSVGVNAETWNGTSWTTITSFSTGRRANSMFGLTSTNAIIVGGDTSGNPFPTQTLTTSTEYWNGSSWTELNDLATGRANAGSSGSSTSGLVEGGYGPPVSYLSATEEFTAASITDQIQNEGQVYYNSTDNTLKLTKVVLGAGAWSSGGSMNTARRTYDNTAGSQTDGLVYSGYTTAAVGNTELYNGTSWSEQNDLNTARYASSGSGDVSTAAFCATGLAAPGRVTNNETWNGTSWTEVNDVNTARNSGGASGSSTAGLIAGGEASTGTTAATESWNGTSWTEVNDLNQDRIIMPLTGTQTATLAISGKNGPGSVTYTNVEEFDGTSWTEIADVNTGRATGGAAGTVDSALAIGGNSTTYTGVTESYNGTSWTEVADLATARGNTSGLGSSSSALCSGGTTVPGANTSATEEWNVPSSIQNSTITTS